MTIESLLIAAVTALAGVVVFMWKVLAVQHADLEKEVRECREDREGLHEEVSTLKLIVGAARWCQQPDCATRKMLWDKEREGLEQ